MSSSSESILEQISKKLHKAIKLNFSHQFVADVIVTKVDRTAASFVGKNDCYVLRCLTDLDISSLAEGQQIRLQGKIVAERNNIGSSYVKVDRFFEIKNSVRYEDEIKKYMTTAKEFNESDKLKDQLKVIYQRTGPKIIHDVGVVVLSDHKFILDTFKAQFQERCVGNLFVYKIPDDLTRNNPDYTQSNLYTEAIKFFNRKRVDLVCVLTDRLTLGQTLSLSSADAIRNTYRYSKSGVYTVGISQKNLLTYELKINTNDAVGSVGSDDSVVPEITDYHCFRLTNKQFKSVYECISMIHDVQTSHKRMISDALGMAKNEMIEIIDSYRSQLLAIEMLNTQPILKSKSDSMNGKRRSKSVSLKNFSKKILNEHPIDELKELILTKLDNEKNKLVGIELDLTKSMIEMTLNPKTIEAIRSYEKNNSENKL